MSMRKKILLFLAGFIALAVIIALLNREPEVITKTEVKIEKVTDTVIKTKIIEKPVKVPVIIYKDSIIRVKESTVIPTDTPVIQANEFKTTIKSGNASADLQILSTGRVLDVQGVIQYDREIRTTTVTKYIHNSSFFLYGETSIAPAFERLELGVDYVIKDRVIIGASGSYNLIHDHASLNIKFGIKL